MWEELHDQIEKTKNRYKINKTNLKKNALKSIKENYKTKNKYQIYKN